jgi:hypothetical protein
MARQAHLIGSVSLPNAQMVMTTVADFLGDCCTRIPDGETGERGYWIRWQKASFDNCDGLKLETVSQSVPGYKDTLERPFYNIKKGVEPASLDLGDLGYAREAIASYATFNDLKADGIIGADVRFQVSIPSPLALIVGFIVKAGQLAVEPAVVAAIERDLAKLQSAIPPADLSIQFDVCHEVVGYDGGAEIPYEDILEGSAERIGHICDLVNDGVELGIHLCYGDPGHKHVIEPKDLATSVAFANGISKSTSRLVNFMHMAVPVDRNDEAYFAPLQGLEMAAETRLILGLVHYSDGLEGSKARLAAAEKFAPEFDIATECGFGRRDAATIPELLQIHRDLCD